MLMLKDQQRGWWAQANEPNQARCAAAPERYHTSRHIIPVSYGGEGVGEGKACLVKGWWIRVCGSVEDQEKAGLVFCPKS